MKRIISILLVVTLAFGLTSLAGTGAVADTTSTNSYATVTSTNGYGVRMREGPGTNYNVVTKYPVNTTVIVLQKGSAWSQITVGDLTGWMMNQYLIFGASGATPGSTTPTGVANATVTSGNGLRVWLRATAGGKRLALYRPGTQVTVLEKGDKWCRISIGGSVGYMMTEFLNFGSAPAPASLTVKGVTLNYDYPSADDVLEASLNPAEATVTYSWKVNGVEQSTAATFTVLARYEGQKITLDVKGTGAYTGSAHTQTNPVQNDPYIKGVTINKVKPVVGDVLTAQVQPSSATVDYAWRVGGTLMGSDATYTVQPSDVGKPIQVKVTGIGEYTGSAVATATANVTSQYELQSVTLNKETPVVGDVLTAAIEPQSASVSIAWYVGGRKAADTASYNVDAKDLGQKVEVKVTGAAPYSGTVSAVTNRVVSANLTSVAITGTAREGETLYTKLSPAGASASYQWYLEDGTKLTDETSASLKLSKDWIDKKVYVVATGAGAYGGQVTSGVSAVIESSTKITGVKLNLNAPVVGDTLKATVLPSSVNDHAGELSFVWTIDTQTVSGAGMNSYTIRPEDKGKQIRVQVIGVAPYTGEAYSDWTEKAAGSAEVNGLWIYNTTLKKSANDYAPEVGNVLRADTNPGQATVTYQWYVDKKEQPGETNQTFTVPAGSEGKAIMVTVQGTGSYSKTRSSSTKAVAGVKPLDISMTITAPEAGKTPVYTVADVPVEKDSKGNVTKVAKGTVTWTSTTHSTTLDEYNHYWGGDAYKAVLTVTAPSGYSCTTSGAKVTLNGKTAIEQSGNTWTFEGFATGVTQVSDFNITGIPRPAVGEKAVTADNSSSQYTLAIAWDGVTGGQFIMQEEYKAAITVTAKEGFTLEGVPANAFKVSGADEVTSTASADGKTLTVTAVYKVPTTLSISVDTTQVEMDGVNRRIVQLKARLSNGAEFVSNVTWGLSNVDANGTIIENYAALKNYNSDVKLVIDPVETVGKSIKITAAYQNLKAEATVALVSGSNYDNGLQVVITQVSRSKDAQGNLHVKLSAYVRNSLLGVNWLEPSAGTMIQKDDYNAELVVSAAEIDTFQKEMALTNDTFAKNIMVRAESQEDKSLQGKLIIDIPKEESKSDTDSDVTSLATDEMTIASFEAPLDEGEVLDGVQILISDAELPGEVNVNLPEEENGEPSEEEVNTGLFEDQQPGETPAEENQNQQPGETPAEENQNQQPGETPAEENQNQQPGETPAEENQNQQPGETPAEENQNQQPGETPAEENQQPGEELTGPVVAIFTDVTKSEKEPEPESEEETADQAENGAGKKDKGAAKNDKVTEEEIEYEEVTDEKSPYRVRLGRSHSGNVYAFRVSPVKDGAEITSVTWRIQKGEDAKALSLESDTVFKVSAEKTFSVEYTVTFADGGKLVKVRTIRLGKDAETKKPAGEEALENPAVQDEIKQPEQPALDEKEMGDAAIREGNVDVEETNPNHEASDAYKQMQKDLSDF